MCTPLFMTFYNPPRPHPYFIHPPPTPLPTPTKRTCPYVHAGTPWFMSPEALGSEYYPASDVWSAGVMAHQLLTGKLPFNDKRNPHNPSLTAVW